MNMFQLPVEKRNSVCGEVYRPTKIIREEYSRNFNRKTSIIQQQTKIPHEGYFSERAQSQANKKDLERAKSQANKTDI